MFELVAYKDSLMKRIVACLVAFAFACTLVPTLAFAAPATQSDGMGTLGVTYRSQREVVQYYRDNVKSLYQDPNYDVASKATAPYVAGQASQGTLDQALAVLNFIRYTAGLSANVKLDSEYTAAAQAAVLLNAANGELSQSPRQPQGMSDEMYAAGSTGAANSNIYASPALVGLGSAMIDGWMNDSSSSTISSLSHRRWLLSPKLGKTGFGIITDGAIFTGYRTWAAMYTADFTGAGAATNVAWPAASTPIELFSANSAWSLATGDDLDPATVKVKVTRAVDNRTWNFSQGASDGDFYVDNNSYGQKGCIIFRPSDVEIGIGELYDVEVTGVPNPVSYRVNFFGLEDNTISSVSLSEYSYVFTGNEIAPKATVKYYDRVLTEDVDYKATYANNINVGTATITIRGINDFEGSTKTTQFRILPASAVPPEGSDGSATNPGPSEPKGEPVIMYRLYNPNSGEHFYTHDVVERAFLIKEGWTDEGVGWTAPSDGDEVYRLYNANAGEHHYTLDANERDVLKELGWTYEGIGWHSGGMTPVFREYNPNEFANNHNYTTDQNEHETLISIGWLNEGIGWYAIA